ncbi:MAG: chromosome segregation protein SMC, partial [Clostridia bacterium]|nr:chromosome segregation protein SMC [Clostridia bacterium]
DNDFVSVTRRYYRSHESEYLINNVSVRLKDINELFMDTGLGRDGYSMIGQGKIDSIISSKSGERRDIFEEASGISKYRYRKIESERRLKDAEENLIRLKDIMSELESRVGPLKEQSKKAEEFLKLAEKKKELEISLWLYMLDNSKDALRNQESKIAAAQLRYQEIENALKSFDEQTEKNSADFAKLTSDIEGERQQISRFNEEIVLKTGNITVINNDISHNNDSIERLKSEAEQLSSSDAAAREEILSKRNEAQLKKQEEEELNLKLSSLEKELSGLLSDSESISRKIEEQARLLNGISAQIADKRVEMVTANTAIAEIKSRSETLDNSISEKESEYEELTSEYAETEKFLDKTEENINSYKNIIDGYTLKLSAMQLEADKLKEKSENIRLEAESKRRRVQILTDLESNMEGFNNSVKCVMEEAKKGVIKGICGPVSKIISVDKQYSVAIETALGAAIQNIVVETENDAKRAINFLKSENKGRATFLPVSSIISRDFSDKGLDNFYGFIGNAAELVSSDSKYKEIIKYLLAGTIIAEDIDSAVNIAKKNNYRFKVVSLDGQVINPGGSLTGGSLIRSAGILSRSADIKD